MDPITHQPNPELDLLLEREIDLAPELAWAAWTQPEHIVHWFTPAPWQTVWCEIDLRPGGAFKTVMRSPEGEEFPGESCFLEIVPNRKLVWTNALAPGCRPIGAPVAGGKECDEIIFTAVIALVPYSTGTKYSALAIHREKAGCIRHAEMGFHSDWGAALDQLVAHMKKP